MRTICLGQIAVIGVALGALCSKPLLADYQFVTFDYPQQSSTGLAAINSGGQIVGGFSDSLQTFVTSFFTDTRGTVGPTFQYVGSSGINFTGAAGIDDAGDVIGTFFNPSGNVFLRSAAGAFTKLPLPPGLTQVYGVAISGNGRIVVGAGQSMYFRAADGTYTSVVAPGAGTAFNPRDEALRRIDAAL